MPPLISISAIDQFLNKEVVLQGWVFNKRSSGGIIFLQLRDGTGFIQCTVVKSSVSELVFKHAERVNLESSVEISGVVKEDQRAPMGYELSVNQIKIIQLASDDYPIGKKDHGVDFLMSHRHLWLRSPRQYALLKIRARLIRALESFYTKEGFTRIDTPIISPSACEGTTTLFSIDYFGKPAYLSQSGQLYLEAAIASFGKVYNLAPVFRAEKSKTRRHLIEFWMSDAEIAFCHLEDNIKIQEQLIAYIVKTVLVECEELLVLIERDTELLKQVKIPFERIKYKDVVKKLRELGSDIKEGEDLGNDDESLLMRYYQQPVFVTHYPVKVKAFYMKRDPVEQDKALCSDLLVPEEYGEVIGGSEREDDYNKLLQTMREERLSLEDYSWYLDLRKYGSVPHSGFGLGIERLLAWICGLDHVRETLPFPRMLYRFRP